MKNLVLSTIILMAVALTFSSCDKDKDDPTPKNSALGKYEIYIDNELYSKGENILMPIVLQNLDKSYINLSIFSGKTEADNTEVTISVNQFPRIIGTTITIEYDGDPGLVIVGNNILYTTREGTLKRETATRISFTGKVSKGILNDELLTMSGFVEAESLKKVD